MTSNSREVVNAGPYRYSITNSGIDVSVGLIKIGSGPKVHYVRNKKEGFYYNSSKNRLSANGTQKFPDRTLSSNDIDWIDIHSSSINEMQPSNLKSILDEVNSNCNKIDTSIILLIFMCLMTLGAYFVEFNFGGL